MKSGIQIAASKSANAAGTDDTVAGNNQWKPVCTASLTNRSGQSVILRDCAVSQHFTTGMAAIACHTFC
jgi:hypothetical protein